MSLARPAYLVAFLVVRGLDTLGRPRLAEVVYRRQLGIPLFCFLSQRGYKLLSLRLGQV